ncbi:hypothetical protein [Aureliella helgolandensis]|nr:hypothetical protein [Aureliella helgolandensis]
MQRTRWLSQPGADRDEPRPELQLSWEVVEKPDGFPNTLLVTGVNVG